MHRSSAPSLTPSVRFKVEPTAPDSSPHLQGVRVPDGREVLHGLGGRLLVHVQLLAQRLQTPAHRTLLHPPRLRIRRLFAPHPAGRTDPTVALPATSLESPNSRTRLGPRGPTRARRRRRLLDSPPLPQQHHQQHGRHTSAGNSHNAARWRENRGGSDQSRARAASAPRPLPHPTGLVLLSANRCARASLSCMLAAKN